MTTLPDRMHSALLVIDVQVGVVAGAPRRDEVVASIAQLVDRARRAGVPVIWVQHASDELQPGTDVWSYVPELVPDASEPLIEKRYGDAFEATELEDVLRAMKVGRLLVCGAQTDACIRSTLHGALVRGYDTILIGDAHTTEDLTAWGVPPPEQVIAHTNLYWSDQQAPGRTAGTVISTEVNFAG
jgi:nicotinamidase-related amidase